MGQLRHSVLSGVVLPIGVPIWVNSVVSRVLYMGHNQPLKALHDCLSTELQNDSHSGLSLLSWGREWWWWWWQAVSRQVGTDACEREAL